MTSLLAVLEQSTTEAFHLMQDIHIRHEPEATVYLARHYSYLGAADEAIGMLQQSAAAGFVCAPETLRRDPWLTTVRAHPRYQEIEAEALRAVNRARSVLQTAVAWGKDGARS